MLARIFDLSSFNMWLCRGRWEISSASAVLEWNANDRRRLCHLRCM